jgi:hypothetical protein
MNKKNMQIQNESPLHSDLNDANGISFLEILIFFKTGYKTIYISGFIGLVFSGIYLLFTPFLYEATVNVSMTRILLNNSSWLNIEEPSALIVRASNSSNLQTELINVCGFDASGDVGGEFARYIKLSIPKPTPTAVEIRVFRPTRELAKVCADSIYQFIVKSQVEMGKSLSETSKAKNSSDLAKIDKRLSEDRALVARSQNRDSLTPTHFALFNQIRSLEDQRDLLLAVPQGEMMQQPPLNPSIYVSERPVHPKTVTNLAIGFLAGILLGICVVLGLQARKAIRRIDLGKL